MQVLIKGHIDSGWFDRLGGPTGTYTAGRETILTGQVPDQPALYGLLNMLSDLGIQLISVSAGGDIDISMTVYPNGPSGKYYGMLSFSK